MPNPADPQSFNRYSYVQNSPLTYNDPSGHDLCEVARNHVCDGSMTKAEAELIRYCGSGMRCYGEGISRVKVDLYFYSNVAGEDLGTISLPIHTNPDYADPSSLFPWEGVADVLFPEHGAYHPAHAWYANYTPDSEGNNWVEWFTNNYLGDATGIVQTMINRAESSEFNYESPNDAALKKGQYASPYRDVEDNIWVEHIGIAYATVMLNVRVDQPYAYFAHQDLNSVRFYNDTSRNDPPKNESTAFGPSSGYKDHYVRSYPYIGPRN